MPRTKVICKLNSERFAVLLPHIEWALMNDLLSFDQVAELMARECVQFDLVDVE